MVRLSYWVIPILGGTVWLATLLALLLYWIVHEHRVRYPSMEAGQTIAYISDVGASDLKPLFVVGCVLTAVLLDISFAADRWLRHRGRLAPNTRTREKVLSSLAIVFAVVGTAGLILLSIFDTVNHRSLHNVFLYLFVVGYVLSAIFISWEYWDLGRTHRSARVLRLSFYIKLAFVTVEIVLAVAFIARLNTGHSDSAAVLEWVVAFVFSAFVFSFCVDLYPAAETKQRQQKVGAAAAAPSLHDAASDAEMCAAARRLERRPPRSGSWSRAMARNF
ncbi:hypothetical protein VTH06DRAFT_6535 [Thermothelomyces fergusii]